MARKRNNIQTELNRERKKAIENIRKQVNRKRNPTNYVKIWSSSGDNNVCPICKELDGMAVDFNEDFVLKDGTRFFGDKGACEECRCAIMFVEKDDYENGYY